MTKTTNMYKLSIKQWSPFVGCKHDCKYCRSSFQTQLKRWAKKNCPQCYNFLPHEHPERLHQQLPRTRYMQFIFTCASGDIAFCHRVFLQKIVNRIRSEPAKTFLIQSKNPETFNRVKSLPWNLIVGTTLETNRDHLYHLISRGPKPSQRYKDFLEVNHPVKMVTCEPLLDFDLDVIIDWITNINPCMVWIGYDSRKNYLPEPKLDKVKSLYWELGTRGFTVVLKKIRPAWCEK